MTRTETGVVLTSNGRGVTTYTKGDETCTINTESMTALDKIKRAIGKLFDVIAGRVADVGVVAD